MATLASPIST